MTILQPPVVENSHSIISGQNILVAENLRAYYGSFLAVKDINMAIHPKAITAIIGPSGCGKSTLIRCFNRMHEVVHGARVTGKILLDGENIYAPTVDPVNLRHRV